LCAECGATPADIVFVLDSSSSETQAHFQQQLHFVHDFASQFQIGPNNIQVSVVTFSTQVHPQFFLNQYHDQAALLTAINSIPYQRGTTHTEYALRYVRETSFLPVHGGGRPHAAKIVIVLTDGEASSASHAHTEAGLLKNVPGIQVIAVGIGNYVKHAEIQYIASDVDHAFSVGNFAALNSIKSELAYAACQSKVLCYTFLQ
jgi:hypothetical protein